MGLAIISKDCDPNVQTGVYIDGTPKFRECADVSTVAPLNLSQSSGEVCASLPEVIQSWQTKQTGDEIQKTQWLATELQKAASYDTNSCFSELAYLLGSAETPLIAEALRLIPNDFKAASILSLLPTMDGGKYQEVVGHLDARPAHAAKANRFGVTPYISPQRGQRINTFIRAVEIVNAPALSEEKVASIVIKTLGILADALPDNRLTTERMHRVLQRYWDQHQLSIGGFVTDENGRLRMISVQHLKSQHSST